MFKKYQVNNIFNDNGLTLNELITKFLISFLDNDFELLKSDGIINTDIISNL